MPDWKILLLSQITLTPVPTPMSGSSTHFLAEKWTFNKAFYLKWSLTFTSLNLWEIHPHICLTRQDLVRVGVIPQVKSITAMVYHRGSWNSVVIMESCTGTLYFQWAFYPVYFVSKLGKLIFQLRTGSAPPEKTNCTLDKQFSAYPL